MTPLLSFTLTLMVFGGCLSAPSTTSQPPCAESEGMRNLLKRLSILEKLVRDLKGQCTTPCCGKVQSGADDPSSLKPPPCEKDDGCPGGCGGDERGTCVDGECHCKEGYMGDKCQLKTCPEDCNDQGRCINGRCSCFAGFSGLSCGFKACPNNCHNRGHCQDGVCACDPGFSGVDCSARVCPRDCLNRGRCENGLCICYEGYAGVDCSSSSCPNNCNQRGDCENGICMCDTGFTGVDCGFKTCLHDCNDHGKCEDGVCVCDSGYFGEDCSSRACPDDCNEQGQCVSGRCVCDPGFDGPDCGIKVCSPECEKRGRCEHGECVCDPGFTGPDCELTICPNDCHNQGQCEDGTCICNPGFAGPDCGIKDCPNKCSNRGRCQNGICICPAGFTGPDCSSRACPKNCSGNGQCINGKCICDLGFVGPVCGTRSCPAGCSNHGRCIRGTCVCSPGYSGVDCSVRSCPKNCHDRGRCEGGVCFCDPGFTGLDCGAKRCPNDCFDRGHCEDGVCVCDYGFTGRNCGTRTCPNDCYDRGRCEDGVCICITGFKGEDCSIRTCPNDCYDRGTCDSGICICNEGYKGVDCGLTTCPNDCHNQGQCEDGVCVCDLGYTGVDCSTRTCPNNCYKRGQCVDGDCVCNPGYTGVDCASKACPENCNGRGTCDDGKCICYSGYSGPNCGYRACPNNCYDRGQCEDGVCVCDSGYTDIDCGVRTCPGNCQNRGQCDDGVCICTSGYTGPDCGQRTCPWDCSSHGRCDNGKCLCDSGYVGVDCSIRACPESCNVHGECENGVCVCNPGFTGLDCSTKACPKNCNNNGQCVNGKCICNLGFSGPVCGARVCPANCNGRGKCVNGVCVCKKGFGGADCGSEEVDLVAVTGLRVTSQEEAAVTLEWDQPQTPPSSYDITFKAKKENGILTTTVDGLLITFYQTGLAPGEEYIVSIQPRQGSTLGPETSITARTRIETPRGLQVIEVTNVSMLIRWEKPQSLPDRYIVTLIHPNGKERKLRVPGKGDRIRVPGLDANTEYRVVLRAEKGTEHSLDTETTAVTAGKEQKHLNFEEGNQDHETGGKTQIIHTSRTTLHSVEENQPVPGKDLSPGSEEDQGATKTIHKVITVGQKGGKVIQTTKNITTVIRTIQRTQLIKGGKVLGVHHETEDSDYSSSIPVHGQDGVTKTTVNDDDDDDYPEAGRLRPHDRREHLPGRKVEQWMITRNITHITTPSKDPSTHLKKGDIDEDLEGTTTTRSKVRISGTGRLPQNSNVAKKLMEMELKEKTVAQSNNDADSAQVHPEDPSRTHVDVKLSHTAHKDHSDLSESETTPERSGESSMETGQTRLKGKENIVDDPSDPTKSKRRITSLVTIKKTVHTSRRKGIDGDEDRGVYNDTGRGEVYDEFIEPAGKGKNQTRFWGPSIKAVIENLPEKLSLYNGTFIQRLESYLRATSYPLRANQTVESVSRAIYLYLVKWKPDSFTGMVYDRLPQKTPGATGYSEPTGGSRLQGNIGNTVAESKVQELSNTTAKLQDEQLLKGKPDSVRTVSGAPRVKTSGKVQAVGETDLSSSEVAHENVKVQGKTTVGNVNELGAPEAVLSKPPLDERKKQRKPLPPPKKPTTPDRKNKKENVPQRVTTVTPTLENPTPDASLLKEETEDTKQVLQAIDRQTSQEKPPVVINQIPGSGEDHGKRDRIKSPTLPKIPSPGAQGRPSIQQRSPTSLVISLEGLEFLWDRVVIFYNPWPPAAGATPEKMEVDRGVRQVEIQNLTPGTSYRFDLHGLLRGRSSKSYSLVAETAPLATTAPPYQAVVEVTTSPPTKSTPAPVTPRPGPPLGGLQVRDITSDSVTVVWKARPKMFDSFLIRYEDVTDGTAPKEISAPGDQREVTLRDLTQNTRYAISVFGIRGGKLSRPLKEEVTTDARDERPTPRLSPISVSEVKPDSFRLTWESIDGDFDAYVLQYGPIGGPNEEETLPGDQTSFLATGLASNVNYSVEIRGLWREGHSDPATTHVFTEKLLPPQLESLSPSDVHSDSVHLSWVVKGRDFDSFVLSYRDGEGRPQEVPLEGDIRSYDVKELKPAKKYKFTLYGLSDGKKSKPVTAEISTDKSLPPRLESFSASDIRSDSVRLSWLVDGGEFDSFLLLYRDPDGKSKELTLDGEQRTVAAEDLKPGKKYKFILYGITGGKRSKAAIVETSTVPKKLHPTAAPPALPRLVKLVANKLTKESVELSWMVEGKEAFDWIILQFKEPGGGMRELQIPGQETSTVVQGLIPSQTYEFSVYGIKGDKRGRPQTTDYITDPAAYDGPPILTGLYISPHGPHAIHLSWEAPQGSFDSFRVRYRVQGQDEPVNMATAEGPDRNLLLTDLQPDTVYSVTLHGIREGEERWSLQGTGKTGPLGLEPPKNLRFNDVAEKSATASWDPPNSETTTFKVSYQPAEGGEPESVSVSGTTTPLKRLTPGTRYEVTVVSVRGFEESTPLTDFFTTAGGGPRSLRAHDVTEVSALLRWEAPTGPVDRYLLTYRAENIPAISVPVPGDKTELRLTSLHPRTEYFVSVQSSHGSVTSAPASTSFTTSADAPRDLTATQITARSALLTWKAPDTAPTGYLLTYQAPQGEAKEIRLLSNLTSFMLSRLDPTTEYRVQLHALRNSGSSVPISTSFTTGRIRYPFPRDCWEQRMDGEVQNGLFTIFLGGDKQEKMKVYCDMETDGGGWIVFQRRMDGSTDFYRDWADYRNGFGNITSEFWLGNTALHKITSLVPYELRVDLHSADDSAYALYDNFLVEPEEKQFRLQLGQYKGTAGDSLSYHNNMVFSTRDRDTQKRILPCAMSYRGAWWYRNCHYANLNGMYGNNKDHQGINWHTWKGFEFSIPFTEMKMRPRGVANRRRL